MIFLHSPKSVHEARVLDLNALDVADGAYLVWQVDRQRARTWSAVVREHRLELPVAEPGELTCDSIVALLPTKADDDPALFDERPLAILRQAIANLVAIRALGGHITDASTALCIHFRSAQPTRTLAPLSGAPGRPSTDGPWKLWSRYLALREQLQSEGVQMPAGRLYRHLRVESQPASMRGIIDRLNRETGTFNYRPYSLGDAVEIARAHDVNVIEVPTGSNDITDPPSSLVRLYRDGDSIATYILVQAGLPSATQTFLVLYELGHVLRDFCELQNLPPNVRSDSFILNLPHDPLDTFAHSKAESFALVGLLPTPDLVWEFRDELDKSFGQLLEQSRLKPEVQERVAGVLSIELELSDQTPLDWKRLFTRRLHTVFRYSQSPASWLRRIIGDAPLSLDQAKALSMGFRGCWARLDKHHRLESYSPDYRAFLHLPDSRLLGRAVSELADDKSHDRFDLIRRRWQDSPRPVVYHFGFCSQPPLLARLLSFPVVDQAGRIDGSLAIFDELHGESIVEWPSLSGNAIEPAAEVSYSEPDTVDVIRASPLKESALREDMVRMSTSPVQVLHLAFDHGRLSEAREAATRALETAASREDLVTWLRTCAKLRASQAAPQVLRLLRAKHEMPIRTALLDAARSVAFETKYADEVAQVLLFEADSLLPESPTIASRTLMGFLILSRERGWGEVAYRLVQWPASHLDLPLRALVEQLARTPHQRRRASEHYSVLVRSVDVFSGRLETPEQSDDFALASAIELQALTVTTPNVAKLTRQLMRRAAEGSAVVRCGAMVGLRLLLREHASAVMTELSRSASLSDEVANYVDPLYIQP